MKKMTFFEPVWSGNAHLVANAGLIRIAHAAFGESEKIYIGDSEQYRLITEMNPPGETGKIMFIPWNAGADADTLPIHAWKFRQRLSGAAAVALRASDLIALTSCSANTLTAVTSMGLAHKTMAILHGNANELSGWRSRNPLRRLFDMKASLQRYCRHGGTVIVLEERIKKGLSQQFPWMAHSIECLPHALASEESRPAHEPKPFTYPIKIGFVGLATNAKGFPEFLKLAEMLKRRKPEAFQFHAIGKLHTECSALDQSMLATKSGTQSLDRKSFIEALKDLNYIFIWHQDYYYTNAASGVLYDAINLGIPVIARKGSQISEWEASGQTIGSSHSQIEDAVAWLDSVTIETEENNYRAQQQNQSHLRESLSVPHLAMKFIEIGKGISSRASRS